MGFRKPLCSKNKRFVKGMYYSVRIENLFLSARTLGITSCWHLKLAKRSRGCPCRCITLRCLGLVPLQVYHDLCQQTALTRPADVNVRLFLAIFMPYFLGYSCGGAYDDGHRTSSGQFVDVASLVRMSCLGRLLTTVASGPSCTWTRWKSAFQSSFAC